MPKNYAACATAGLAMCLILSNDKYTEKSNSNN